MWGLQTEPEPGETKRRQVLEQEPEKAQSGQGGVGLYQCSPLGGGDFGRHIEPSARCPAHRTRSAARSTWPCRVTGLGPGTSDGGYVLDLDRA